MEHVIFGSIAVSCELRGREIVRTTSLGLGVQGQAPQHL